MSGFGRFFPDHLGCYAIAEFAAKSDRADECLVSRPRGGKGTNLLYGNFYNLDLPVSKPKDEEKEGFTPLPSHFFTIQAPLFYYIM